jgi:UDP-2,3-diacylglucosamine hydrolase
MVGWRKLGLIAGGGELPVALAEYCRQQGRDYYVARVEHLADPALDAHPGATHNLGAIGARMEALKAAGVDAIVLIGQVPRPDMRTLQLDARGQAMVPAVLAAAAKGDDALMRVVLDEHEREGFRVVGADDVMGDLLAAEGAWGTHAPTPQHTKDVVKGAKIAAVIGSFDIAQGVVVCDGLVLAVEAAEGTDQMLARVAGLPAPLRGASDNRRGVLVKRPKPIQERRIDLPVIGVKTVEGAARAGLAGIAVEAHGALVVRREEMIAEADRLGLFVYGFTRTEVGEG